MQHTMRMALRAAEVGSLHTCAASQCDKSIDKEIYDTVSSISKDVHVEK
jgi:hypothetical protein